jgi:hypothetical protein
MLRPIVDHLLEAAHNHNIPVKNVIELVRERNEQLINQGGQHP